MKLTLEIIQSKFAGTIEKNGVKYTVCFENSNRAYSYKCNLKDLAEKLKIDISECTIPVHTKKENELCTIEKGENNDTTALNLFNNNAELIKTLGIEEIKNTLLKIKSEKLEGQTTFIIAKINPKTEKIQIVVTEKRKFSGLNRYYDLVAISNNPYTLKESDYELYKNIMIRHVDEFGICNKHPYGRA